MANIAVDYRPMDRRIWEEELAAFVPEKLFDAHAHLWSDDHLPSDHPDRGVRTYADLAAHRAWAERLYPGREIHFLMLGCPVTAAMDVAAHNVFLAKEIAKDALSRASMIATPGMTPKEVSDAVDRYEFIGLKPYRVFSATGDVVACRITDYLPESLIEVANDRELFVTLHLSKRWGCADEENLVDLARLGARYPKVRWILAHCARSFASWMIEQAVVRLREMPQIWYDLSAVNDVMSFYMLFKRERRERLLFGSDNIVAGCAHSKYITFAKAWAYIPDHVFEQLNLSHCEGEPTLVIYEQLRAMRQAAEMVGFGRAEAEDVFYTNAARLFGLIDP